MTLALGVSVALLVSAAPYVDTKQRFQLELPPGWRLLPAYGDTFGMRFQRELPGGRVSLTVHVDPVETDLFEAFVSELEGWVLEQGLERRSRTNAKVGPHPAVVINFDSAASKKDDVATLARSYFFEDGGHRYHLHVSASPRFALQRAEPELRALLGSFATRSVRESEPASASPAADPRLLGMWLNPANIPFRLDPEGGFQMGAARGRYLVQGETLSLMIDGKSLQTFRFEVREDRLYLHSDRLKTPAVYRRGRVRAEAASSSPLVGLWRATIPGGTLELKLESAGRFTLEGHRGRWVHESGLLSLTTDSGEVITYAAEVEGERLSLSGGDLEETLWLQKIPAG